MSSAAMGDIIRYRSPRSHGDTTGFIGMVVFLGAWTMMFAALFFIYGAIRMRTATWPPADQQPLPVGLPAINTAVLALSSVALQAALTLLRRGRMRTLLPLLGATLTLGILFLVLQTVVWQRVAAAGMKPSAGPYASVFYGLTWLHGAHVLVGLLALVWLAVGAARGLYSAPRHQSVRLWTMYWHFVGVVWAVMFVTVYLI